MKKKKRLHYHKGIIGLEAAIILIAFVIIASSVSYVALNMGFATSQTSKTTIGSALGGTSGTLMISGTIIGAGQIETSRINVTAIPIKVGPTGDSVNLATAVTAVKYFNNIITYDNIYRGTLNPGIETSLRSATFAAELFSYIDVNPFVDDDYPTKTSAFIYWSQNHNDNDILEFGEKAILAIVFAENDRPMEDDFIQIEIISPSGPTLTIERKIPTITTEVVNLQ